MLSAAQVAQISRLLDEALDLDPVQRRVWLDKLAPEYRDLQPALRQALLPDEGHVDVLDTLPTLSHLEGTRAQAESQARLEAGQRIGPYRLVRRLGEGGMAEVWLGERADGAFKRDVALKLPMQRGLRKDLADRFVQERDILAALEHPNIARLYDAGVSDQGRPYLAMEYVDGEPLTTWCDSRRVSVQRRLELFLQVLDAVQYAHAHHVIHRDIKPSNILATAAGQIRLLDFGVAKLLSNASTAPLTQTYGPALTPEYASPELARGGSIDVAADVYSLGVVLYELLTGRRPYQLQPDTSVARLQQAIAAMTIEPPSALLARDAGPSHGVSREELARRLRGDLDAVVLKALAKAPEQRYRCAEEFAQDLQRHLDGRPVTARPDRLSYRLTKFVLRHRNAAVSAGVVAVLAAALIAIGIAPTRLRGVTAAPTTNPPSVTTIAAGSEAVERSIAVLPFTDMSERKDQEYFSDGLSEELIDLLSKVPQLRIPARTSSFYFKGKSEDIGTIARKLRVEHVLEGSIRKAGNRLRVTAQLIRGDDGFLVWSQTYDRGLKDVFQVQDEIAASVVAALKVRLLSGQENANPFRTESSEAHDHYLLGMLFWNRGDHEESKRAAQEFSAAIALDPGYAMAYAGLANAESRLADENGDAAMLRDAAAAAERAVTLAPALAQAYAARGNIRASYLWDWDGAEADLSKALSLDERAADIQSIYSELMVARARLPEALTAIRQAVEGDPLSSLNWLRLGIDQEYSDDLPAARHSFERARELAPESDRVRWNIAEIDVLDGHPQDGLERFRSVRSPLRLYGTALAEHALGRERESEAALQRLIADHAQGYAYQIAEAYAYRGQPQQAFQWLERAYSNNDGGMTELAFDPFFKRLRADPRFKAMLKRMKVAAG